jgi:pilus assembly protein CpaE
MKIKVLHKNDTRYEVIRKALAEKDKGAMISGGNYVAKTLPEAINGAALDVLIVDEGASASLDAVEALSLRSPGTDTLMISADMSADFLMRAMRAGVREVIPESGGQDALQNALIRVMHKRSSRIGVASKPEGRVFAFVSCKGGSGATFLSSNFAYVLATYGKRVALIDLNLQFGDAAIFVTDKRPPSNVAELSRQIHRLDASLLEASMLEAAPNFFVLAAPEDPVQSVDVKREHVEAIIKLAQSHFDFVVLDLSRSLDAVTLQGLDMADVVLPVLQLTLPFVRDGKRLLSIFRTLGYARSKIQVVVNRYEKGGELSLQDLEQTVDEKVFHVIPNSYAAAAASVNLGVPIFKSAKDNPISKVLLEMGRKFMPVDVAAEGKGFFARMLSPRGKP